MKKICYLFVIVLLLSFNVFSIVSAEDSIDVYVTICDGDIKLAAKKITVKDIDSDGALTINDALFLAHESEYQGGAQAGYASSNDIYGLKIDMLWGVKQDVSFGYYLNNSSAMSLGDVLSEGDYVSAFVYQDLTSWSDTYSFFDKLNLKTNGKFTLELSTSGYDEMWNPITSPLSDAVITINGIPTEFKTNSKGKVEIELSNKGNYVISAISDSVNLVPPVCNVTVLSDDATDIPTENPGDFGMSLFVILGVISLGAIVFLKHRKNYEA
jgi:hypothetical protein